MSQIPRLGDEDLQRGLIIILTHMDSKVAWSPDAALLETMLATPEGGVFLWELHAERLATSAATLGFGCPDRSMLLQQVTAISASHAAPGRLRLLLRRDGSVVIERSELPAVTTEPALELPASPVGAQRCVMLDSMPQSRHDVRLRFKTTDRAPYDDARARAGVGTDGVFDVLLYNDAGEVTECSIANVVRVPLRLPRRATLRAQHAAWLMHAAPRCVWS